MFLVSYKELLQRSHFLKTLLKSRMGFRRLLVSVLLLRPFVRRIRYINHPFFHVK
ncbi:DNA protection during starvation protein [Listeria monocytogenes]|nr:DNA protection during starvation protein [Listeria monocytogenes]